MRFLSILLVLIACFWVMSLKELADSQQKLMAGDSGKMSLAFTENKGQWPDSVRYRADTEGATVWLTAAGIYYQFLRHTQEGVTSEDSTLEPYPLSFVRQQERVDQLLIKASFVGANPEPQALGEEMLRFRCNYFLSGDSSEWRTDVPNYGSIVYRDLYPGIDLRCYGNGRQLEYDYIVSPGADYTQVRMRYDGAKSVRINDQSGELVIETDWGAVTERIAAVYQIIDGERKEIAAKYCSFEDNTFGFKLRDTYNPQVALIIDPVMTYSTFFGGSSDEYGSGIALDQAGNYYITGATMSSNFPTKSAYDSSLGGDRSAYIAKFSALDSLVYSTYLGSYSYGYDIAVDDSGCAYITGYTYGDIPTTANPFQDSYDGAYAAFVTKLNSAGDSLVYSTYLAGSGYYNDGDGIAVDSYGSAYVTGYTSSSDFPILNPYDSSYNGGIDAFVTKFNPAGNTLAFSTYLGGSSDDHGYDIAVDNSGNVWVSGVTNSSNFPTLNAYDSTYNGNQDGFVTKLNSSGNNLLGSTYLGGSGDEAYCLLVVDDAGKAYVTGQTSSSNFPTTAGVFDSTFNGGLDIFVVKFGIVCSNLVYSTYLGGSGDDWGIPQIAVDGSGNAHVTGNTNSSNFPLVDAVDSTLGGPEDAFVAEVNSDGSRLLYGTYLGGSGIEVGEGITVDGSCNVYVTGRTNSSDFPTMNAYDSSYNGAGGYYGWGDVFITKLHYWKLGDANGDCVINVNDVVYLINCLFVPGSPCPDPPEAGDVNCDGKVNASDVVCLINYLFISGPLPCW